MPDEYYFCDLEKGAWRCPEVSIKGRLTKVSHSFGAMKQNVAEELKETATSAGDVTDLDGNSDDAYSTPQDMREHFSLSDVVGKRLGKIHFSFDSHQMHSYGSRIVSLLAPAVKGKSIVLLGYTDNTGTELYNDTLALKRAEKVKAEFVKQGVPATNIHVEGNGNCCYLETNGTDEQRQINRRVEIYLAD